MSGVRESGTSLRIALWGTVCLIAASGCSTLGSSPESMGQIRETREITIPAQDGDPLFSSLTVVSSQEDSRQEGDFEAPEQLRPCCAFGHDLKVRIGFVPVLGYRVDNVVDPERLGRHRYDAGLVSVENGLSHGFVSRESNGLAYTCRGGFIDIAHVRDYADWTAYLTHQIEGMLDAGGAVELPKEGGRRFFYVMPIDSRLLAKAGRRNIAVSLAQWLAIQISIWHETATWYGWSSSSVFPEVASAFSPEDLYSNLLGIQIAGALLRAHAAESETEFNWNMNALLGPVLDRLGAVPNGVTREAARSVDGIWWDSSARLPSNRVVLHRSLEIGPELTPWLVPPQYFSSDMREAVVEHCGEEEMRAAVLRVPSTIHGIDPQRIARLDIEVGNELLERFPLPQSESRWISQDDFPRIITSIRSEILEELGAGADQRLAENPF